jgi:hypothetical protein
MGNSNNDESSGHAAEEMCQVTQTRMVCALTYRTRLDKTGVSMNVSGAEYVERIPRGERKAEGPQTTRM